MTERPTHSDKPAKLFPDSSYQPSVWELPDPQKRLHNLRLARLTRSAEKLQALKTGKPTLNTELPIESPVVVQSGVLVEETDTPTLYILAGKNSTESISVPPYIEEPDTPTLNILAGLEKKPTSNSDQNSAKLSSLEYKIEANPETQVPTLEKLIFEAPTYVMPTVLPITERLSSTPLKKLRLIKEE